MKYRFVSELQFDTWARQNYAKEFAPHFKKWDDVFETEDLECETMVDTIEIAGKTVMSCEWYPFTMEDLGNRIVEVKE